MAKPNRGTKEGGMSKTPKPQLGAAKVPDSSASLGKMPMHARKAQHVGSSATQVHGATGGTKYGKKKGK